MASDFATLQLLPCAIQNTFCQTQGLFHETLGTPNTKELLTGAIIDSIYKSSLTHSLRRSAHSGSAAIPLPTESR